MYKIFILYIVVCTEHCKSNLKYFKVFLLHLDEELSVGDIYGYCHSTKIISKFMSLISSNGKELSHLKYYEGKVALALSGKLTIPRAMVIWNILLGAFTEKQRRVLSCWVSKSRDRKWRFQTRKASLTLSI